MTTPFVHISEWDQIPGVISQMQAAGAEHRIPLLQALYHGRIAHLEMARAGSATKLKRWIASARLPALLLLGDDDQATPDGPGTWPVAQRAMAWARFVLLHGAAGRVEHYRLAVKLTEQYGRLVMVECSSANIPAWKAAAERWGRGIEGQIITPVPGNPHPSLAAEPIH